MREAWFFDTDIALLGDLSPVANIRRPETSILTLKGQLGSTYATLYSKAGLESFCVYTSRFYNRVLEDIAVDIETYGSNYPARVKLYDKKVDAIFLTLGGHPKLRSTQFSDMHLFRSFLQQPTISSLAQDFGWSGATLHAMHQLKSLTQRVGVECVADDWFERLNGRLLVPSRKDTLVEVMIDGSALLGIHFQGRCKMGMARFVRKWLSAEELHQNEKSSPRPYGCNAGATLEEHTAGGGHGDVCRPNSGAIGFTCPFGCQKVDTGRPYCKWQGTSTPCHARSNESRSRAKLVR